MKTVKVLVLTEAEARDLLFQHWCNLGADPGFLHDMMMLEDHGVQFPSIKAMTFKQVADELGNSEHMTDPLLKLHDVDVVAIEDGKGETLEVVNRKRDAKSVEPDQDVSVPRLHGLPDTFWVVTFPSATSELSDICNETTWKQLLCWARGGLEWHEIVLVTSDEADAKSRAQELLKARG